MADFNSTEPQSQVPAQIVERPMAVWVFGVLNIVFGFYFLVRMGYSWSKIIAGGFKNPGEITWSGIPVLLFFVVSTGLIVWLIVLGIGLLTMKRWARRGSVLYGWIQVAIIVITLGGIFISSIIDWENAPRILWASININNALAVIHWIYMVLLLVFMKTKKVKRAFAAAGG
jgi:hypothetical protein